MKTRYVPILKCKKGEQVALAQLNDNVKDSIIPLIEIPLTPANTKKPTAEIIDSFWFGRKYYFYFLPEWYEDLENFQQFVNEKILPLCKTGLAIPVLDLSSVNSIEDWVPLSKNGIAIRLRNNEYGDIEEILNPLFNTVELERTKTDLIFDLQFVASDDLFSKTSMLKAAFSDLENVSQFNSIIISSVSFPRQLPPMESQTIYHFGRTETEILAVSLKLAERFKFQYIYSDYGPADIELIPYVVGMTPNFKIKYTSLADYVYIKGFSLKKGGLEIENVRRLAKILVESPDFSGSDYSWGDQKIFEIASQTCLSPGSLTTWVSYSMNHHITFILKQI